MEIARLRYYTLCMVSGGLWSIVAFLFGYRALGTGIWGGMVVSPLIGFLIGWATWPVRQASPKLLIAISTAAIYISGILFGLAVGIFKMLMGPAGRNLLEVLWEPILTILWGITLTGFLILFLPAAYFNFWLINRSIDN